MPRSAFFVFLLSLATSTIQAVAAQSPRGSIKGRVVDAHTQRPMPGASVEILDTEWRTVTAADGRYTLAEIPVGEYRVLFQEASHQPLVQTDVVVRPTRITYLNAAMSFVVRSDSVTVAASDFTPEQPASEVRFNAEEIRRAPGSANDISRALYALPGIAQTEDLANDLIVRGGSPFENAFFIDNIPAVNINHFPQLGASGGNITMLNTDFVESIDASTGGFPAEYGNALSSVFDIRYRDGNREKSEGQLDLNMTGFGGTYEGPLGKRASWLFSAKRSFLDLVAGSLGETEKATWGDVNARLVWDVSERHRVSVLSIDGDSRSDRTQEQAQKSGESYGWERFRQYVNGVNWRALWGSRAVSETSVSYNGQRITELWRDPGGADLRDDLHFSNDIWSLRNVNEVDFGPSYNLKGGVDVSYRRAAQRDALDPTVTNSRSGWTTAAHLGQTWRPWKRLSTTLGVRADRLACPDKVYWSPRLGASLMIGRRLTLDASIGRYVQQLPLSLLGQDKANESLDAPRVMHIIAGFKYNPSAHSQISVEGYRKSYDRFPLSAQEPLRFVIDDVHGDSDSFGHYGALTDGGRAKVTGVDFLFQLKPTPKLFGTMGLSLSRNRYRDMTGVWRNRYFDNRYVFSLVAGYKAGKSWELGARWIVAGGKAFTPIDVERSMAAGETVGVAGQEMAAHYPAYQSLNLRLDRRFNFRSKNLAAYVSVWNVYNHANVLYQYWDPASAAVAAETQWSFLPVAGIEFEF